MEVKMVALQFQSGDRRGGNAVLELAREGSGGTCAGAGADGSVDSEVIGASNGHGRADERRTEDEGGSQNEGENFFREDNNSDGEWRWRWR